MAESTEFSRLSSIKQCPICGGKLDKGYSVRYWGNERQLLDRIAPDSLKPALWTADIVPALKCENCEITIADYRSPAYTPKSFLKKCVNCGKDIPMASENCQYCGTRQSRTAK